MGATTGETDPKEAPVSSPRPSGEPSSAVLDAPVIVRVELAAVSLSVREWSELAVGDVLALGQPPRGRVALRVDGVLVGRGELVDIDGELGVRVLEVSSGARSE